MPRATLPLLMALVTACGAPANPYLSVARASAPGGTLLRLEPAPGVRINAQQKPVLQLPDSTRLQFDAPGITPDSAYFTEPPTLLVATEPEGQIIASVCPSGEYVCRPVVFELP